MANELDFRVKNGLAVTTTATIESTIDSSSPTTGALRVAGGVGINNSLNVGGATRFFSTTNATSTATGAVRVEGGVGIAGNLFVGGSINVAGTINATVTGTITTATNIALGTAGQVPYQTGPGATSFFGPGTSGQILVSAGTSAPTYTNTVSIQVGFASTATNVRGGTAGQLVFQTATGVTSFVGPGTAGQLLVSNGAAAPVYTNTASIHVNAANGAGQSSRIAITNDISATAPNYLTAVSTSSGFQSLEVTAAWGPFVIPATGQLVVNTSTAATTTQTGALRVIGGAGIGGNLYTEGIVKIGNHELMGTTTWVRKYASGYSNTHTPTEVHEIGRLTLLNASENITITGEVRAASGATTGVSRFILGIRSNTLPSKSFSLYEDAVNLGIDVQVKVYENTATGLVIIGYISQQAIQNIGWTLNVQERGDYNYLQQVTALTTATTSTLSEIVATPTAIQEVTGIFDILNSTQATSTNSGALQVTGGAGIGRNLFVGENVNIAGVTTVTNTTNATTTQTGALQVRGGVGVGGSLVASNIEIIQGAGGGPTSNVGLRLTNGTYTLNSLARASAGNYNPLVQADDSLIYFTNGNQGFGNLVIAPWSSTSSGIRISNLGVITISALTSATSTTTGALVVAGGAGIGNNLIVGGNANASSTTTGALQVAGGVGIGGNLYVGGEIVAQKLTIELTTVTTTLVVTDDIIQTTNATNATSTITGALQVRGGAGIGGDVWVGGSLNVAGTINATVVGITSTATNIAGGTAGQVPYQTGPGATSFYGPGTAGQILVSAGAAAPVYTNTGSIYVQNAVISTNIRGGVAGSLPYQSAANATTLLGIGSAGTILTSSGTAPQWSTTASLHVNAANGAGQADRVAITNDLSATVPNYLVAVSTSSGYQSLEVTAAWGPFVIPSTGQVVINTTTNASSTITGALRVVGGAGIQGDVFIFRSLNVGAGLSASTGITLNNNDISGVNQIVFSDPGPGEGINFNSNYQIYESPDDLVTNTGGNLQFVANGLRRVTFDRTGVVTITTTTNATSTATGALQVRGGVGIAGNIWVGGGANIAGITTITNTTAASLPTTGALQVAGGVGIGGALWVENSIFAKGGAIELRDETTASVLLASFQQQGLGVVLEMGRLDGFVVSPAIDFHSSGGNIDYDSRIISVGGNTATIGQARLDLQANQVYLSSTQTATSTQTGALRIVGGVGIGENLYVGGTIFGTISGSITTATNIAGGTAGQVPYQSAPGATLFFGPGTAGQILVSNGAAAPVYTNTASIQVGYASNIAGGAQGDLHYQDANGVTRFINKGSIGNLLQSNGTTSTFVSTTTVHVGNANYAVSAGSSNSANFATNLLNGTAGAIPIQSAANTTRFILPGTTGQLLQSQGTTATFVNTSSIHVATANFAVNAQNVLATVSTATSIAGGTAGQLLFQTATGVTSFVGPGTAGQILVSNGAAAPVYTNTASIHVGTANYAVTAGTSTNASNAITANSVNSILRTTNAAHFLTFVDSNNASSTAELIYTTSSFSINPSTGNVGVGTNSPAVSLDVRGVIQGQSYTVPETGGSAQWVRLGTLTIPQMGYTVKIRTYLHAGYNAVNSQDFYVDIFFKTSNASSVDSNGFAANSWYYSIGNNAHDVTPKWVGNNTGTTATSYDLFLNLPSFTANSHYIVEMVQGVTWTHVGTVGVAAPGADSATTETSTLSYNIPIGNVGIGTVSPTSKLHVDGTARITGITTVTNTTNATSTTSGALQVVGGAGIGQNLYVGGNLNVTGTISGTLSGNAATVSTVQQTGNSSYFLTFVDSNNASATAESVYTTSTLVVNARTGNVGIGNSSPVAKLQSSGAAQTTPTGGSVTGAGLYINNTDTAYGMMFGVASTGIGWIQQQRSDSNTQYDLALNPIGGNIGIGINAPTSTLHVSGGTAMTAGWNRTATLQATYPVLVLNSNNTKWAGIGYDHSSNFNIWVNALSNDVITGTVALSIAQTGNITIGGNLTVNGTIFGNLTGVATTATNLAGGANGSLPYQTAAGATTFLGIGTNGFVLTSNGTVPTWQALSGLSSGSATTATNLAGGTTGQIPYQTNPGSTSFFGPGTAGQLLVSAGAAIPVYTNTASIHVGTANFAASAGSVSQALTMNNGGAGAASGTTYNGGTARTISYNTIGAPKAASAANSVYSLDARAVADIPSGRDAGLYIDFKTNTTDGLVDGGTYHGVLTFRSYGSGTDISGGQVQQIAYTENNNLWHRLGASTSTWGSWVKVIDTANTSTAHVATANYAATAGTTTGASGVTTVAQTGNATYFLTFVDSNNASATAESIYTTSTITTNPREGSMAIGGTASGGAKLDIITAAGNSSNASLRITNSAALIHMLPANTAGGWNPLAAAGDQTLMFTGGTQGSGNFVIAPWSNTSTGIRIAFDGTVSIPQSLSVTVGATIDSVRIGVTAANEIDTTSGNLVLDSTGGTVTVDDNLSVSGNATITGNLTVNGTTITVDSTVTNVSDPIFIIGTGPAGADPTSDDNKDRGVGFKWHTGSAARLGFFGYDDSTGYFTFIPNATITSEIVSGAKGAIDVNLAGGTTGSLPYQSAADTTTYLGIGTTGYVLVSTGSAPSWQPVSVISAGTATNANALLTVQNGSNATFYPMFVDSNNATGAYESAYTTSSFSLNASTGDVTITGDLTVSGGQITTNSVSTRDKLRVWTDATYTIGMQNSFTFGSLETDYAMTFQMSNTDARGFWWGDTGHTQAQGAMALSTNGKLTVAHSVRVGYGESDVTLPGATYVLDVNGAALVPKLYIGRNASAATGINWYSNSYTTWQTYMAQAGQTNVGTQANITVPSGSLVTSWGLRNYIEDAAGYGWTWESGTGTSDTTPTVVAEIRSSDGSMKISGDFMARSKSFLIDHPTKPGMKLRYGSLEGPENGVYVRGKLTGSNTIELPDYWTKLVDPNSITVNLTPIGRHQNLYVEEIINNTVVIGNSNLMNKDISCYYTVFAERKDVGKLEVEIY